MIKKEVINEVKDRLVKAYNPIAIYIFGSYAWGTPTEDSDLDLLIVVDKSDEKSYKRPIAGYRALREVDIPNDIIVYTQEEFERLSQNITTLCHKIATEGEQVYARA